jgi:hypothetical protein
LKDGEKYTKFEEISVKFNLLCVERGVSIGGKINLFDMYIITTNKTKIYKNID